MTRSIVTEILKSAYDLLQDQTGLDFHEEQNIKCVMQSATPSEILWNKCVTLVWALKLQPQISSEKTKKMGKLNDCR